MAVTRSRDGWLEIRAFSGGTKAVTDAGGSAGEKSRNELVRAGLADCLPCTRTRSGSPVAASAQTSTAAMLLAGCCGVIRRPGALRPAIRCEPSRTASWGSAWLSSRRPSSGGSRSAAIGNRTCGGTGEPVRSTALDS